MQSHTTAYIEHSRRVIAFLSALRKSVLELKILFFRFYFLGRKGMQVVKAHRYAIYCFTRTHLLLFDVKKKIGA